MNGHTTIAAEEGPPPPHPSTKSKKLSRRSSSIRSDASVSNKNRGQGARGSGKDGLNSSTGSDGLDSTAHRIRGGGILASSRDINIPPAEFAEGCKLLQAAARGDIHTVKILLRHNPAHINFRDYDRRTALHVAASEGHLPIVKHLVDAGANVNRSDRWGGSPLDDAHRHRHEDVVSYLRGHGATTGNADQTTNLITAAAEGDLDEVRMLLTVAPTRTLDLSSSSGGRGKTTLIVNPIDINAGDYDKRTALHLAAGEGHAEVVDLLCRKGANVNIEDRWGGRPLDDAKRRNFTEVVTMLEKYGAESGKGLGGLHISDGVENSGTNSAGSQKTAQSQIEEENMRVDFEELEMIERIGSGAFGEIYKCRWRGILVAAKCIKTTKIRREWMAKNRREKEEGGDTDISAEKEEELSETAKRLALEDFRQETAILRTLRHPNICMLLAYSTTENFEVMISELMKCSLLDIFKANILQNTNLPKRQQIVYAQQLAQGMNYLHTCKPPIIHRDLKPANLLIDFTGILKISDFGLAKIRPDPETREEEQFRMTGETGSYRFMAPEVFRHEDYTETVDIYSFAMIFFYLLAGRPPWPSSNGLKAVSKAALEGERPYIPREWDGRLARLLQQCWDENPQSRPPFSTILRDLSDYSRDVFKTKADSVAMTLPEKGCNCVIS